MANERIFGWNGKTMIGVVDDSITDENWSSSTGALKVKNPCVIDFTVENSEEGSSVITWSFAPLFWNDLVSSAEAKSGNWCFGEGSWVSSPITDGINETLINGYNALFTV